MPARVWAERPSSAAYERVLLDACIPRRRERDLEDRDVTHVADIGWHGARNGRLFARMREDGFEMLVTIDRNLQFQHNVSAAHPRVLVLLEAA